MEAIAHPELSIQGHVWSSQVLSMLPASSLCSWRNVSPVSVCPWRHPDTLTVKSFFCGLGCHVAPHFLPSYTEVHSPHPQQIICTCHSDCPCFYMGILLPQLSRHFFLLSIPVGSLWLPTQWESPTKDLLEHGPINTLLNGVLFPCLA